MADAPAPDTGSLALAAGRRLGGRIHNLVRIPPLLLPLGFSVLWLYAILFAPAGG